jgi:purine nucleosidase
MREKLEASFEIYAGSSSPLDRDLETSDSHGGKGFGEFKPSGFSADGDAIEFLESFKGDDVDLVCLGPLTKIARCLDQSSSTIEKFAKVTIIGGDFNFSGNVTPSAKFNFCCDPEAADKVLRAEGEKFLVPLMYVKKLELKENFSRTQSS